MHCQHCGTLLPENAKFCTACGQPVEAATEGPEQTAVNGEEPIAAEEPAQEQEAEGYTPPENASEGYKAANAQLPPSYSNPNYGSSSGSAYTGASASSNTNVLAIAGFVCSLIFVPIGLGTLSAIAGLVLSILGLNSAKKLPENKGHGLALAGIIISAIRIAIMLVLLFALLVLMVRSAGHVGHEVISNWSDYVPYYNFH